MGFVRSYIFVLLALALAPAAAQPLKIGYVNGFRVENESPLAQQTIEQIKKEFAPREQQLRDLQKEGADLQSDLDKNGLTMAPADKQAKEKRLSALAQQFQQAQRALAEDFEARKNEARARFLSEVNVIIKGIAEAGKYDLIVQQAVYSNAQIDITDQVLKEMAKRAAATPAAPAPAPTPGK